jgi:hypothetical protein
LPYQSELRLYRSLEVIVMTTSRWETPNRQVHRSHVNLQLHHHSQVGDATASSQSPSLRPPLRLGPLQSLPRTTITFSSWRAAAVRDIHSSRHLPLRGPAVPDQPAPSESFATPALTAPFVGGGGVGGDGDRAGDSKNVRAASR